MNELSIALLGPPEVKLDGRPVAFRTRKALALLAYLAVEGGAQPRDRLAALLWPASDPAQARGMLRTTLQHLRKALAAPEERAPLLLAHGDTLALARAAGVALDLDQLHATAQQVGLGLPDDRPALRALLEAAAFVRGEFMQGFALNDVPAFDHWVQAQQQRWRQHAERVFDELVRLLFAAGEPAQALAIARRWSASDPLHETALQWQMRLLFANGEEIGALRLFETHVAALERELGLRPGPDLVALAEQIRQDRPATTHEPPAPASPTALPAASPMVGRAHELSRLIAILHAFRGGHPRAALVAGEAGIGKTRLARELTRLAAADGLDVWQARALEAVGHVSYQVVLDAVRARIDRENAPVDLLSDVWLAELSRLLPELRDRYPDLPQPLAVGESEAQMRLFEAVARLVHAVAARRPIVLFVDDLQWADAASLDLLHYLARQCAARRTPLLLLATIRAEDMAAPALAGWLAALGRALPIDRVSLRALTVAHIQQWVQALAGNLNSAPPADLLPAIQAFSSWLHEETGGQPFFMTETVRTMRERGLVGAAGPAGDTAIDVRAAARVVDDRAGVRAALGIPSGVRDIVRARTQRLSAAAADLLAAAAIIGTAASFEIMCAVAELDEREGLRALDELLDARLLQETMADQGARYMVAHDKIRAVLYASAGEARRRAYHRRAFAALRDAGATPSELARHAGAADLSAEAARWSLAAGDQALRLFDVGQAIEHYEQAAGMLGGALEQLDPAAYLRLGRTYELSGQVARAEQAYTRLLDFAHAEELQVAALSRLATLAIQDFDEPRMNDLMARMLEIARTTSDRRLQAQVAWTLAQSNNYLARLDFAQEQGERALRLATEIGDDELAAHSLNALAYIYSGTYQAHKALAAAEESTRRYAALGNPAMESDSLAQIASAEMRLGRPRAAIAASRRCRARAEAVENRWGVANGDAQLAIALSESGELGEAWRTAAAAFQTAREQQIAFLIPVSQMTLGAVARAVLRLDDARALLSEALTLGLPQSLNLRATAELCAVYALRGDWPAAHELALELHGRSVHPLFLSGRAIWLETTALLRMGDRARAAAHVDRFGAAIADGPRAAIDHQRALATLMLFEGRHDRAIEQMARAAASAERLGLPVELWQILAALAGAYAQAGDSAAAQAALARSQAVLSSLADSIADEPDRAAFKRAARQLEEDLLVQPSKRQR